MKDSDEGFPGSNTDCESYLAQRMDSTEQTSHKASATWELTYAPFLSMSGNCSDEK